VGGGKRIVFVVVLFRRFLINDGYFEKDQMKKLMLFGGQKMERGGSGNDGMSSESI
jgi:hypothetical protein